MNIILNIQGMSCEHCTARVTQALKALPGVHSVSVSLFDNAASVDYDENIADRRQIVNAIQDVGFDVICD